MLPSASTMPPQNSTLLAFPLPKRLRLAAQNNTDGSHQRDLPLSGSGSGSGVKAVNKRSFPPPAPAPNGPKFQQKPVASSNVSKISAALPAEPTRADLVPNIPGNVQYPRKTPAVIDSNINIALPYDGVGAHTVIVKKMTPKGSDESSVVSAERSTPSSFSFVPITKTYRFSKLADTRPLHDGVRHAENHDYLADLPDLAKSDDSFYSDAESVFSSKSVKETKKDAVIKDSKPIAKEQTVAISKEKGQTVISADKRELKTNVVAVPSITSPKKEAQPKLSIASIDINPASDTGDDETPAEKASTKAEQVQKSDKIANGPSPREAEEGKPPSTPAGKDDVDPFQVLDEAIRKGISLRDVNIFSDAQSEGVVDEHTLPLPVLTDSDELSEHETEDYDDDDIVEGTHKQEKATEQSVAEGTPAVASSGTPASSSGDLVRAPQGVASTAVQEEYPHNPSPADLVQSLKGLTSLRVRFKIKSRMHEITKAQAVHLLGNAELFREAVTNIEGNIVNFNVRVPFKRMVESKTWNELVQVAQAPGRGGRRVECECPTLDQLCDHPGHGLVGILLYPDVHSEESAKAFRSAQSVLSEDGMLRISYDQCVLRGEEGKLVDMWLLPGRGSKAVELMVGKAVRRDFRLAMDVDEGSVGRDALGDVGLVLILAAEDLEMEG